MEHPLAVGCGQPPSQPNRDAEYPLPGHRLADGVESLPADIFRDEVRMTLDLPDAMNGDDVWVREPGDGTTLEQKPLSMALVWIDGGDELHRDGTLEEQVLPEKHPPHAAAPERSDKAVAVKLGRRRPFRHQPRQYARVHFLTGDSDCRSPPVQRAWNSGPLRVTGPWAGADKAGRNVGQVCSPATDERTPRDLPFGAARAASTLSSVGGATLERRAFGDSERPAPCSGPESSWRLGQCK